MPATLLALDIGGTDIKAALFRADGTALAEAAAPTPRGSADPGSAVLGAAADLASSLGGPTPEAIGLVIPGIVDEAAGVGVYSANLGWRDYPFREAARELFGVPVGFGHDVGQGGEAEIAAGAAGREAADAAVVVIGTGIGAALFDGGRRISGSGFAGELGHLAVPIEGGTAALEAVASASAIGRRFAERTGRPVPGSREVFEAADARWGTGSEHADAARAVLDEAFDALAFAFLQASTILGTDHFVLTGGLGHAGEALRSPVAERLASATTFQRPPTVSLGVFGVRAGIMGALQCARGAKASA